VVGGADGSSPDTTVFLYAFDLIELDGDDLRRDPLAVRKNEERGSSTSNLSPRTPATGARPAYGHSRVDRPRTCIFFATPNDAQYLKEADRRFLAGCRPPTINIEALRPGRRSTVGGSGTARTRRRVHCSRS
jgi:hypothetical protein